MTRNNQPLAAVNADSPTAGTSWCSKTSLSYSKSLRYTSVTNQSFCRMLPVLSLLWSHGGAISWNYTSTLDLQQATGVTWNVEHRPVDKSYYAVDVTDGLARWLASRASCYRPIQTLTVINYMDKLVGRMSIVASIVNLIQQTTAYCITLRVRLCQAEFTRAVAKFYNSRACGDYSGLTREMCSHVDMQWLDTGNRQY